jgi:hypothetical protein
MERGFCHESFAYLLFFYETPANQEQVTARNSPAVSRLPAARGSSFFPLRNSRVGKPVLVQRKVKLPAYFTASAPTAIRLPNVASL